MEQEGKEWEAGNPINPVAQGREKKVRAIYKGGEVICEVCGYVFDDEYDICNCGISGEEHQNSDEAFLERYEEIQKKRNEEFRKHREEMCKALEEGKISLAEFMDYGE